MTQTYPGAQPVAVVARMCRARRSCMGFDATGRPIKKGAPGSGNESAWISGVTNKAAGQPLAITTTNGQVDRRASLMALPFRVH